MLRPFVVDDRLEPLLLEEQQDAEGCDLARTASPSRKLGRQAYCRTNTAAALFSDDLIVRASGDGNDERIGGLESGVNLSLQQIGTCGLASCQSASWATLAIICKLLYAYFYFNWVVFFAGLSLTTTISLVYDAWLTASPLGQGCIVISFLPALNLLWIMMSFTWHILLWGVTNDFFDCTAALHAGIKMRSRHHWLKTSVTLITGLLVNLPIAFSVVVFLYETQVTEPQQWVWETQFALSGLSISALAILFFTGAILARDHQSQPPPPPPTPPRLLPRSCHPLWFCLSYVLSSETINALIAYLRSPFVDGGPFNQRSTAFGRHAECFEPDLVNLEDETPERYRALGLPLQRHKYEKAWCTPWFTGHYLKRALVKGRGLHGVDHSLCWRSAVQMPWNIILLAVLSLLAAIALSLQAYVLFAFTIGYFLVLPSAYAAAQRFLRGSCGRLLLDCALILIMFAGGLLALSVGAHYLGASVVVIVLLTNLATFLAHLPAIRDRDYPPPATYKESLAFHSKAVTHRIVSTARGWAFVSILCVLALILAIRTVPNATPNQPHMVRSQHGSLKPNTVANHSSETYPFCANRYAGLSVADLAHISNAAYLSLEEARVYIHEELPDRPWQVSLLEVAKETGMAYGPVTYQLQDRQAGLLVFAVRGTNEVFDLYQDLDIWAESLVVQLSTYLFPLYGSPIFQPFLEKLVGSNHHLVQSMASLKDVLLNRRGTGVAQVAKGRYYYDVLYAYLTQHVLPRPSLQGYQVLLTGHSLGGGICAIVGARLGATAVTFSAPGVTLSRRKFGIGMDSIDDFLVNIQPRGDVIPLIDQQGVKAQFIRCQSNTLTYRCHSLVNTLTEIERGCGGLTRR